MAVGFCSKLTNMLSCCFQTIESVVSGGTFPGKTVEWSLDDRETRQLVTEFTPMATVLVDLVVEYLKKSDQVGPEDLKLLCGKRVVSLFGSERGPLPRDIDVTMQQVYPFREKQKITQAMSLIYIPQKVTTNIAKRLCQEQGIEFEDGIIAQIVFEKLGNQEGDAENNWHLVSKDIIDDSFSMDAEEIQEVTRKHAFEWVSLRALLFTIFARSAWTGKKFSSSTETIYISCGDTLSYRKRGCHLEKSCHVMLRVKDGKLAVLPYVQKNLEVGAVVMKRMK